MCENYIVQTQHIAAAITNGKKKVKNAIVHMSINVKKHCHHMTFSRNNDNTSAKKNLIYN